MVDSIANSNRSFAASVDTLASTSVDSSNELASNAVNAPLQRNAVHSRTGRIGVLSHAARVLLAYLIIIASVIPLALTADFSEEPFTLGSSGLAIIGLVIFGLGFIYGLFISIASTVKRLHDINMSGWFYLIYLIPIIGALFYLFVSLKRGTEIENRFGLKSLVSKRESIVGYIGIAALFIITAASIAGTILG